LFERYEEGLWAGTGKGYRGAIRLLVETNTTSIINIEVLESKEDEPAGSTALEELISRTLETGCAGVDAISGATATSEGFFAALNDALAKAKKQTPLAEKTLPR
jgi:urocanate reductase